MAGFCGGGFHHNSESNFYHKKSDDVTGMVAMSKTANAIPGDGAPLQEVHPAYDLTQARPDEFLPKVAGMDFLPDGRLVVSTWDAMGAGYLLDGVQSGDPTKITAGSYTHTKLPTSEQV